MPPRHVQDLIASLQGVGDGRADKPMAVPGCWDALTALLVENAGFPCAFLSGSGLSMTRLGRPDVGLTTASELEDTLWLIRDRVSIPLIVDADTGFGGEFNLQRAVRRLERAGASAIQIEDQRFPKRCGHLAGKSVVPIDEATRRIKAALDARDSALIVARTDAIGPEGFESAMERAEAFLAAGADLIFVEGPHTLEQMSEIGARFRHRAPLLHNLVEGGVTPTRDRAQLGRLGYAVTLHPLVLMHGFIRAAPGWLAALAAEDEMDVADLAEANALVGLSELLADQARLLAEEA